MATYLKEMKAANGMLHTNFGTAARSAIKWAVGATPLPPLIILEKVYWGLRFRKWLTRTNGKGAPYFQERFQLYAYLQNFVLKEAAVDYLEFGVASGESIAEWMRLNTQPDSRFFGFDTFQGLPENWNHFGRTTRRGTFSTNGKPPRCENEPRVSWLIGSFQDVIPGFLRNYNPHNSVVVHLDADLYSSSLYVLAMLNEILRPGTIVLFDEFASFDNEFRALEDFTSAFRRDYRLLACGGPYYDKVAIQF